MRKVTIYYKAIRRHPGWHSCSTSLSMDPFWQGKRFCDPITEFSQTYSILSFQVSRERYLIGKKLEEKNKSKIIKTTLFYN